MLCPEEEEAITSPSVCQLGLISDVLPPSRGQQPTEQPNNRDNRRAGIQTDITPPPCTVSITEVYNTGLGLNVM